MKTIYCYACVAAAISCGQAHSEPAAAPVGTAGTAATPTIAAKAAPSRDGERAAQALEQLRDGLSRSNRGLERRARADGATEVRLDGRFQSATVVVKDASGKRRRMCIDHPAALDAAFGAKP